jgi:N5-(carboxyethyl)ornithine synthase
MKSIGFAISRMENEKRRALIPRHLESIRNTGYLFFERGYGNVLGYSDESYTKWGAHMVSVDECSKKEIVCNPKFPDKEERERFSRNQTLFGWIHAVQNREHVDFLMDRQMTAIAWEEMYKDEVHIFWKNNEIAGEAAVIHAISLVGGRIPNELTAAIIGHGNSGYGALKMLTRLGIRTRIFSHLQTEALKADLHDIDILANCVKWDPLAKGRILYRKDLKKFKKGSLIIDISCNHALEIETTHPTSFNDPIYEIDGIIHYAVDHIPSLFWKTATESIGSEICKYVDDLIEGKGNPILKKSIVIDRGRILDKTISTFQGR